MDGVQLVTLSTLGLAILQIVSASVLPIIVAYVTDSNASSGFKTWALIVLSAVTSVVTSLIATPTFDPQQVVLSFFGILFAAIATHKGVTSTTVVGTPLSGSDSPVAHSGPSLGAPDDSLPRAA